MHNQAKNMNQNEANQKSAEGQEMGSTMQENPYINSANMQNLGQSQQTSAFEQNPYINQNPTSQMQPTQPMQSIPIAQTIPTERDDSLFGSLDSKDFVKGALIGAGVTYVLTNENVQNAIMKMVAKGVNLFQGGVEEMKEKYEDAQAEIEAEKDEQ